MWASVRDGSRSGNAYDLDKSLEILAPFALRKLGIKTQPSRVAQAYNRGTTTQLRSGIVVNVGSRRVSMRIGFGGRSLNMKTVFLNHAEVIGGLIYMKVHPMADEFLFWEA